jgi:predicted regulator of Ras-like GTPase activity (Roadblock/LC7/MglB family)
MFRNILQDLVTSTPGAIGALFLDWEGETVELVGDRPLDADEHGLKIVGAYQGIFLTQLRDLCSRADAGRPHHFKIDFEATRVFSCDLKEGYYLVLVVDNTSHEAVAWRALDDCKARLMPEL